MFHTVIRVLTFHTLSHLIVYSQVINLSHLFIHYVFSFHQFITFLRGRRKQIKEIVKVDGIILVQIIELSHLSFIVCISSVYRIY